MGYMSVKQKDETTLVLLREPSFFSIAIFIAFFIGAAGVFLFGSEPFLVKLLICLGAVGLSCFLLDNYEVCEFDKAKSEVRTTSLHWFQYWMGKVLGSSVQPNVVAKLEDIRDVRVEEQGESTSVKGYQVILVLETGQELGVTEAFTNDDLSSHDKIKDDIRQFLKDYVVSPTDADDEAEDGSNDEDSTEDDFEQISQSELESLKEVPQDAGDGPTETRETGAAAEAGDCAEDKEEKCGHDAQDASS